MNLLADENIDRSVVARLRQAGHHVLEVSEMEPGIGDSTVLTYANEARALLLTEDKDFGELVFRQRLINEGVILTRLAGLAATAKGELLIKVLKAHEEELRGAFTVVSPGAVRIRRQ